MDNFFGRYAFIVEWYDAQASLARRYILMYNCSENSVEMFDVKNNRVFLKRCKVDGLRLSDLYVGNSINIMSRLLDIIDYADDYTRRMLTVESEKAFMVVKPDAFEKIGLILDTLFNEGFRTTKLKSFNVPSSQAEKFYADLANDSSYRPNFLHLSNGTVLAVEVMRQNALPNLLRVVGPTDPHRAKTEAPSSLRARFGTDVIKNAIHCSETMEKVEYETSFFFNNKNIPNSAVMQGSTTCVIIKPHAVNQGIAGQIMQCLIENSYHIRACLMYNMDKMNASEFYEIYKGVVSDYAAMVEELSRSPCIALEVDIAPPNCDERGTPKRLLREFVGPADPDLAQKLRPGTLRAVYGTTKTTNAIHVTDLPEDSIVELEYFFKILDN